MLSETIRQIIKATVPLLKEQGGALTHHFYQRLFTHNPELKQIFNQTHQKTGTQQQSLAMAVVAYADNIDNPSVLTPVLTLIANKHVSLGIRPEHYAIIGHHLLASMTELFGDTLITADVLDAWNQAYNQLAAILIAEESNLYQQATQTKGGWSGWRSFKIQRKVQESDEITSFYLYPTDGGAVPDFRPGQYVSVRLYTPDNEQTQIRQYSLSDAPEHPYLRISVKREDGKNNHPNGWVSNTLHSRCHEGDVIDLSHPMGDFYLHDDRHTPIVLISAGVGLTPMISMLNSALKNTQRPILFIHACRSGKVHAMKSYLNKITDQHINLSKIVFYEHPQVNDIVGQDYDYKGRIDLHALTTRVILPAADYYLCGPIPFLHAQKQALLALNIETHRIHTETFGANLLAQ